MVSLSGIRKFIGGLFIAALMGSPAWAATYYISTSTGTAGGTGAQNDPYDHLNRATSARGAGHVYVFMDGTYSGTNNVFNAVNLTTGSLTVGTTFMAEHDGGVIITAGLAMRDNTTPLQNRLNFEGLKFDDTLEKTIYGNRISFKRCAFKGGPATGSFSVNMKIGGNDNGSNLNRYNLFEDCWAYGRGGRYTIQLFNSENIVFRRFVARHDGGWTEAPSSGNPESAFSVYNSSGVRIQDMILLDGTQSYYAYTQAFYFIHNPSAVPDHVVNDIAVRGLIVLDTFDLCFRADAVSSSSNTFSDLAFADCQNGGMSFGSWNNTSATVNRMGVVKLNRTMSGDFMGGMGYWGTGGGITARNIIVSSQTGNDFDGVSPQYFLTRNNGSSTSGTGQVTYEPLKNGWRYPVRIESGSSLATAGQSGGQLGPNIVNKIGTDGTFWGDPGFDVETSNSLWPWPNEARIKTDFSEVTPTWGWTASTKTLSSWVWEYFGSSTPASVYNASVDVTSPTAPGTPTVSSTGTTTLDITWTVSSDTETGVSFYEVDVSTDNFSTFSAGYNDFNMGSGNTEQLTGLTAATAYVFRVRAVDAQGNTSSSSTAGTGTTSSPASTPTGVIGRFGGSIRIRGPVNISK